MKYILMVVGSTLLSSCASDFVVSQTPNGGVPFRTQELVEVEREILFKVKPGKHHQKFSKYCSGSKIDRTTMMMPVGDLHYIKFKKSQAGKGKFSAQFTASGTISAVGIESDPTALPKALTEGLADVATSAIGILPEYALASGVAGSLDDLTSPVSDTLKRLNAVEQQISAIEQLGSSLSNRLDNVPRSAPLTAPLGLGLRVQPGLPIQIAYIDQDAIEAAQKTVQGLSQLRGEINKIQEDLLSYVEQPDPSQLRAAHCLVRQISIKDIWKVQLKDKIKVKSPS